MKKAQTGIAMSGGVDSTACALMLREQCTVKGFFMRLAQPDYNDQLARVQAIADRLGIELEVVDLRQAFEKRVLDYFTGSYFKGLTPNPCVICNQQIKFGLFQEAMVAAGMERTATGHYARVEKRDGVYRLLKGQDPTKDQTYFLCRLNQQQLSRIQFPLGGMTKEQIYQYVESHGFTDFRGRESQDVCFLNKNEVSSFLDRRCGELKIAAPGPGPIVNTEGKQLGEHSGFFRYTIGQRRGLGVAADRPLYVTALDSTANTVIVGDNSNLMKQDVVLTELHWLSGFPPDTERHYQVRIRSTHKGSAGRLHLDENSGGHIHFDEPQRAITPGQFAAIYDGDELLGSGVIAVR